MKRWHLFEFEDQPWLPTVLRNLQTDFLSAMSCALQIYEPAVPLIDKVLEQTSGRHIVDLGSGAAGPWAQLLEKGWDVTVTLTDRYPNSKAFARAQERFPQRLTYCPEPVDARHLPARFDGMRIMLNSFHHFEPNDAQAILREAVERKAAIGIFEIAQLTPRTLLSMLLGVPPLVLALTPWIRPLTFSRMVWTYCIPLAPALILWDGLASLLRAYSPAELAELAAAANGEDYRWETGRIVPPFPRVPITYLLGCPTVPQP
jgi:SAM-dependent methyltransferase